MKYLVAFKKDGKALIKIGFEDGKEKWAVTSEAVITYAQKNFEKGEEVEFEMTEKNGQYHVAKIMKKGGASPAPASEPAKTSSSAEYKCEDCGATLKDGKYKKCFACNKKNPAPKASASSSGRGDAVGQSIEKQAMMKASAMAVGSAFVGQIADAHVLADMIILVYEKLIKKLTE
jgi:hypothetical protein